MHEAGFSDLALDVQMKVVTPLGAALRHCGEPSHSRHTSVIRHMLMSGANLQTTLEEESEAMEALVEHGHIWPILQAVAAEKEDEVKFHLFGRGLKWSGRFPMLALFIFLLLLSFL